MLKLQIMGFPIIVNGYKLVRASPYKKVYLSTHQTKESRKREPFNEWVENQMGKMTIDQIDELENKIDWRSGKRLDITPTEVMQKSQGLRKQLHQTVYLLQHFPEFGNISGIIQTLKLLRNLHQFGSKERSKERRY